MGEMRLVAAMLRHLIDRYRNSTAIGRALIEWGESNASWLAATSVEGVTIDLAWLDKMAARAAKAREERDPLVALAATLGDLLRLEQVERRLLLFALIAERRARANALVRAMARVQVDMVAMFGALAGMPGSGSAVRASALMQLGLVEVVSDYLEASRIATTWRFDRLLDRGIADGEAVVAAMVGARQSAGLPLDAFVQARESVGLLTGLIRGALDARAAGVNVLIHGPPGTGKTEFARSLAAAAGAELYAVGEQDFYGQEPSREDRIGSLNLGQRAFATRGDTVLLFDEFEDMIGNADMHGDDRIGRREGSKIFVNRLLERNTLPVIWTTNTIANVDPAILRRMSFVLRMDHPSAAAARAMLARIATNEAVALAGGLDDLVARAPQAASVLRSALRTGKLAGGGEAAALASAESLLAALTRRRALPELDGGAFDPGLAEIDGDLPALIDRLVNPATPRDFSLLLTGPPGTGKTGLARHLAERLDRPLIVKRASDLLSKWVGETEQNIADAFAEARTADAVLLLDEIDSILADRSTARTSWEVSQVNELLTWFESHPLPFVAATNFASRLDPAALRRFVFKLELKPLSGARAATAFERFFGAPAPTRLAAVHGITPGDLAVVRRQCRFAATMPDPATIAAMIEREVRFRPETGGRMGF